MKNKNYLIALLFIVSVASLISCKKEDKQHISDESIKAIPAKSFMNLAFSSDNAYFSTDGSMSVPVDSVQAKTMPDKIDITFIFDFDYTMPGFFDPVARSEEWYWNQFQNTWLSTSAKTRYYIVNASKIDFDAARKNQGKISSYFTGTVTELAPHNIFPTGSCIGGRKSSNPESIGLNRGDVFGFKNTTTGKYGLIYIQQDQFQGWPEPMMGENTNVDIIVEK